MVGGKSSIISANMYEWREGTKVRGRREIERSKERERERERERGGYNIIPKAAAVQCAIMNPEFSPPSWTRNAGRLL